MGALQSLQERLNDISECAEEAAKPEDVTNLATPVKPQNKRLLELDPRSPTENINRTPIVVDKTPMAPGVRVRQTSAIPSTPDLADPRSPTTEFTRTPLNPCLTSGASKQNARVKQALSEDLASFQDPRSPTTEFARTPINPCLVSVKDLEAASPTSTITYGSESGIESAEVTPIKGELRFRDIPGEANAESPDSALSENALDLPFVPINSAESPIPSSRHATSQNDDTSVNKDILAVSEMSTPKVRPLALSKLSKQAVEATKQTDGNVMTTRSPLSSVCNVRTGGLTMQKNTVTPVRSKLTTNNTAQTDVDKENCVH